MLAIGLSLFAAAILLLLLALRGRITARGRFCRKCKFDLAGLTDPAACPECGRDLAESRATRSTIRRKHRAGLAAGLLLLIVSGGFFAFASAGTAARILPSLSDRQVITLARLGVGEALTELANRAERVPTMEPRHWQAALPAALAHQADPTIPFDARWGTVLANAFIAGQMTPEQLRAYLNSGYEIDARFRDRTRHGCGLLAFSLELDATRMHANSPNVSGTYSGIPIQIRTVDAGWVGLDHDQPAANWPAMLKHYVWIPTSGSQSTMRSVGGQAIRLDAPWGQFEPGEVRTAFFEFELSLLPPSAEPIIIGRHRFERSVRILEPDAPVIPVVHDDAVLETIRSEMRAGPLKVMLPAADAPDPSPGTSVQMAYILVSLQHIPKGLAGMLSVRIDDREWPLGEVVSGPVRISGNGFSTGTIASWRVDAEDLAAASEAVQTWIDEGTVDIVFRTDPEMGLDKIAVDEVHHADILWPDVAVQHIGEPSMGMSFSSADAVVGAASDPPPAPPDSPADRVSP